MPADIPPPPPVPAFLGPTNDIVARLVKRSNAMNHAQADPFGFFTIQLTESQFQINWGANVTLLTEDFVLNGVIVTGVTPVILSQAAS